MKHLKLILYFVALLISCNSNKQLKKTSSELIGDYYTVEQIETIAEWKYGFNLSIDKLCNTYIFNGIACEQEELKSILVRHTKSEIGLIQTIKPGKNQTWFDKTCDLITLIRTANQKKEEKRAILIQSRKNFMELGELILTDYECKSCPLLSIDGEIITNPYERRTRLDNLKLNEIEYIFFIDQVLNENYFGVNSSNGIVEVQLK